MKSIEIPLSSIVCIEETGEIGAVCAANDDRNLLCIGVDGDGGQNRRWFNPHELKVIEYGRAIDYGKSRGRRTLPHRKS